MLTLNQDDIAYLRGLARTIPTLGAANTYSGTQTFNGFVTCPGGLSSVYGQMTRLGGAGATPPTITAGAGAGTSPTVTILQGTGTHYLSTDFTGSIQITTGTTPSANAAIATVTFGNGSVLSPRARVWLAGPNLVSETARFAGPIYVTPSSTGWTLNIGATALTASTTYIFHYLVTT